MMYNWLPIFTGKVFKLLIYNIYLWNYSHIKWIENAYLNQLKKYKEIKNVHVFAVSKKVWTVAKYLCVNGWKIMAVKVYLKSLESLSVTTNEVWLSCAWGQPLDRQSLAARKMKIIDLNWNIKTKRPRCSTSVKRRKTKLTILIR